MHIKIKINETISIVMPNNLKKVKKEKLGEIWSDNRFLTLKILSYLNKFKIHISQLTAKILLKQRCLNKSDTVWWGVFKSYINLFLIKKYWSISMMFKIKISQFYDQSQHKQWKWNKKRHLSMVHIQIWHHF